MLPVGLNEPEPAKAGMAAVDSSTIATENTSTIVFASGCDFLPPVIRKTSLPESSTMKIERLVIAVRDYSVR
jgi:hypothetical protein